MQSLPAGRTFPGSSLIQLSMLALFLLIVPGCRKVNAPEAEQDYQEIYNLAYGTDSLQKYNLFLPWGRNQDTRMILVIHGGGWVSGEKESADYYAWRLSGFGFAAASMNYRLANDSVHYPEMLADIDSMIGCIAKNRGLWAIGSDKITLFGYSAGGHLALLYSYSLDRGQKVASVISLAGPANIQDSLLWKNGSMFENICLMTGDTIPADWPTANPINFTGPLNPPTLLIHGTNDRVVPVSQSVMLNDRLNISGTPVRMLLLENETHYFSTEATTRILDETRLFISDRSSNTKQP